MANNYLEFSEVIENLTPEEMNWWENDAEKIGKEDDNTVCYDFVLEKDRRIVWFYTDDGCGNVEAVALVVQEFLCKFRPDDCFSMEWASWCSKPRIGEFGGGAMFVTSHKIKFYNTSQWVCSQQNNWNATKKRIARQIIAEDTIWYNDGQGDDDDSNVGWWWRRGCDASVGPFDNREEAKKDAEASK